MSDADHPDQPTAEDGRRDLDEMFIRLFYAVFVAVLGIICFLWCCFWGTKTKPKGGEAR